MVYGVWYSLSTCYLRVPIAVVLGGWWYVGDGNRLISYAFTIRVGPGTQPPSQIWPADVRRWKPCLALDPRLDPADGLIMEKIEILPQSARGSWSSLPLWVTT
jgi:hypothetical protein